MPGLIILVVRSNVWEDPTGLRRVGRAMDAKTIVVGGGAMGTAIVRGLLDSGTLSPADIVVAEIEPERREFLAAEFGVATSPEPSSCVGSAELLILAIKPQNFEELSRSIRPVLHETALVISIMAGVSRTRLREGLGTDRVVRVMPNIAAQVGQAMSVWIGGDGVPTADRAVTKRVLAALGAEIEIEQESLLDVATAVHGSGPAYLYLFAEAWIDAGVAAGLDRLTSELLVRQTIAGSVALWEQSGRLPAELRDAVTSPGGTTAAGIDELERFDFPAAMRAAIDAATRRSRELG